MNEKCFMNLKITKMKEKTLTTLKFEGENLTGIYYWQLFYLMKEVKE